AYGRVPLLGARPWQRELAAFHAAYHRFRADGDVDEVAGRREDVVPAVQLERDAVDGHARAAAHRQHEQLAASGVDGALPAGLQADHVQPGVSPAGALRRETDR